MDMHAASLDAILTLQTRELAETSPVPSLFVERYIPISFLKDALDHKVYLVTDRLDSMPYVLKIAKGQKGVQLLMEHDALLHLHDPAFPRPMQCFTMEGYTCSVRAYVPGQTLAAYAETRALSGPEVITIALEICRIVSLLHGQSPPLVHRDLTPQNFIIDGGGNLCLIDLDSAHTQDLTLQHDTVHLGTIGTAAPEQFGARRSDVRADVYGIGMLMVYLLTNDFDPAALATLRIPRGLQRIIRRCTQFDPARRYATVDQLQKALMVQRNPRCTLVRRTAAMCLGVLLICALALLGIHQYQRPPSPGSHYSFASPLIGQAVAEQLQIPVERITYQDLHYVEELVLHGSSIAYDWYDVYSFGQGNIQGPQAQDSRRGPVGTLEDLRYMPNLHTLGLYYQQITDITPLEGLPLRRLSLSNNPVTDISVLAGMTALEELDLNATHVRDATPLSGLFNLRVLKINDSMVRDMRPLENLPLQDLYIGQNNISDDPSVLERFTLAKSLWIQNTGTVSLPYINRMPSLHHLHFCPYPGRSFAPIENLTELESLGLMGYTLTSLEGIEIFTNLRNLQVHLDNLVDLAPLESLPSLEQLEVAYAPLIDLSTLGNLPSLRHLILQRSQLPKLPAQYRNLELDLRD